MKNLSPFVLRLVINFRAGCIILHCGQELFHSSTIKTVDYIVGQGNLTVDSLRNFSGSLAAAKNIGVDQVFLPVQVQQKIDVIEDKLNSSANEFSTRALENSKKLKQVMDKLCEGWLRNNPLSTELLPGKI